MSYGRDRDAATRGVGAIASRDMRHPHAVRRRQIAKARRLARADRALSGLTYGPVGGLSGGLGALNAATNTPTGLTGGARRPTIVKGGSIEGGGQTPLQIAANNLAALPPRTFISPPKPPPVYTGNVAAALTAIPGIKVLTQPAPKKPLPGKRPPPVPTAPPLPEPSGSVTTTGGKSSGGSSSSGGGSGGGGGASGGGGGSTLPDFAPDDLPDPEDVPAASTTSSSMSTGKMLAIGGGIAAALYLLLQGDD